MIVMLHKCVIGLLHEIDSSHLVSLDGLKEHIRVNILHNQWLDGDHVFKEYEGLKSKVWSLSDYADKRKSTDLTRFEFCPECGKKIDWQAIKNDVEI